jgi:multidrug efflux pump
VIRRIRRETAGVVGVSLYLQPVEDLTLNTSLGLTQYQFIVENPDQAALSAWVPKLVERLRASPALADVASDLSNGGLETALIIDRATAVRAIAAFSRATPSMRPASCASVRS